MQSVLMFHGIGDPPAGVPAEEVPYWVPVQSFQAIVAMVRRRSAPADVVWTFDDGNATDMFGAAELAAAGLKAKFYVLSGRVGEPRYLSKSDIRELDSLGMEVGSHGRDHVDWRKADDTTLDAETIGARDALADIIGKPVTSVAIPFGAYDRRVIAHLRRLPFETIYTSDTGPSRPGDRFVRRNPVMSSHGAAEVADIIADKVPVGRKIRRSIAPLLKRTLR
jgi:peptidoglycan/xylan/chitin deacetylase (PgdA/CDA1 family)